MALRRARSEEHTSELQSPVQLVCRLLLEKKKPIRAAEIAPTDQAPPMAMARNPGSGGTGAVSSEIWRRAAATTVTIRFCFNDTATTEIYTLSLHDALPITDPNPEAHGIYNQNPLVNGLGYHGVGDRKSTRLDSSHPSISYAAFCLKKK